MYVCVYVTGESVDVHLSVGKDNLHEKILKKNPQTLFFVLEKSENSPSIIKKRRFSMH